MKILLSITHRLLKSNNSHLSDVLNTDLQNAKVLYKKMLIFLLVGCNLFLTILFPVSLLLITASCNNPASIKTGSISARIVFTDDSGNEITDPSLFVGAVAGLYNYPSADSTIVRILQEYPSIGANYYSTAAFDHREHTPSSITAISSEGEFGFSGLVAGDYILVVIKESFDLEYIHITLLAGEDKDVGLLHLTPVVEIHGAYESDIVFLSGKQYHVTGDASFIGAVTIECGTRIFVDPTLSMRFYDSFICGGQNEEKNWQITSAYGVWGFENPIDDFSEYAGSCVFYSSNSTIKNGKINYLNNPLVVYSDNSLVENMYIEYFGTGITIQNSTAEISKSILVTGVSTGISIIGEQHSFVLEKSLIAQQRDAINVYLPGGFSINNNYFVNNDYAIRPDRYSGIIAHNCFDRNFFDIYQFQVNQAIDISYNNFFFSYSKTIFPRKAAIINNNNFYKTTGYFIWIRADAPPSYSYVNGDINATNNYWFESDVDQYIQDATDNPDFPGEECLHYVNISPRRLSPVLSAGINN